MWAWSELVNNNNNNNSFKMLMNIVRCTAGAGHSFSTVFNMHILNVLMPIEY